MTGWLASAAAKARQGSTFSVLSPALRCPERSACHREQVQARSEQPEVHWVMTNVQLPDDVAEELKAFTGQTSADAAVLQLAQDFLREQRQRQRRILEFVGAFDADPEYDYKEQRRVP